MALHDLTPQLRTRLSRVERAVGWFVFLATGLLLFGFVYYVYNTAQRKGWFTPKFNYQTSLNNAAGLKVGDPIKLMGNPAGQITEIIPNDPAAWYGVTVNFTVLKPHYGYIWDDSKVKVSSDLLGNRFLEITKGKSGVATILESTNRVPEALLRWQVIETARKQVLEDLRQANPGMEGTNFAKFDWLVKESLNSRVAAQPEEFYTNLTEIYWITPEETAALNERLERVANTVEQALPNILDLTNKIAAVLDNSAVLTSNLNQVALNVQPLLESLRPTIANLAGITADIQGPGKLGEWLIPTNINQRLDATLGSTDEAVQSLTESLDHLANITSNLNVQVQANTNMLGSISKTVVDADDLVQGLKRHWLLKSAFKPAKTNAPARSRR